MPAEALRFLAARPDKDISLRIEADVQPEKFNFSLGGAGFEGRCVIITILRSYVVGGKTPDL